MSDATKDEVKGRLKEAGGDLTDERTWERGKVDRAGTVKDKADDTADKVKAVIGKDWRLSGSPLPSKEVRTLTIGAGVFLIALGAILKYAVTASVAAYRLRRLAWSWWSLAS